MLRESHFFLIVCRLRRTAISRRWRVVDEEEWEKKEPAVRARGWSSMNFCRLNCSWLDCPLYNTLKATYQYSCLFIALIFFSTIFARTVKIRACLKYRKNATNKTKHEEYRTDGDDGCAGLYIVALSSLLRPSMSITNTEKESDNSLSRTRRWPSRYRRLSKRELISSRFDG